VRRDGARAVPSHATADAPGGGPPRQSPADRKAALLGIDATHQDIPVGKTTPPPYARRSRDLARWPELDVKSVALVRPAQPVVGGATVSSSADGEPFATDGEGEQYRPGPSLCSVVHSWNGGGTVAVTAEAPVHETQHLRPPALMSIAHALG
jgi:hypothetical protein